MNDNHENSIRDKMNSLATAPEGIILNHDRIWQRIEEQQKTIPKQYNFKNRFAWSMVGLLIVSCLVLYSTKDHLVTVSKVKPKKKLNTNIVNTFDTLPVKALPKVKVKYVHGYKNTNNEKTIHSPVLTVEDTARRIIGTSDTVSISLVKPDTNRTPEVNVDIKSYPVVDKKLDEDYRFGKLSPMQMILGTDGEIKYNKTKELKNKKKKR